MQIEEEVRLTPSQISSFLERATAFLEQNGVEPRPTHHTNLVLEELMANAAMHGGGQDLVARVRIAIQPDHVQAELSDSGEPFDPTSVPEPDISASIADRPIGGLGLFLVRRLSSTFTYERRDGYNCMSVSIPRRPASAADR